MRRGGGRKTESSAEVRSREAFVLAEQHVPPGSSRTIELPIARLALGTWSVMPVAVVHGYGAGPTVWLSGAVHGDEVNGIEIVRRVLLRVRPESLAGTILAVPITNIFGVTIASRYLPDRRDLNRCFPGSKKGSLGSRLARIFFEEVAMRCELGIDFHTGSNGRSNLPQVRCDLDDGPTRNLALAFAPKLLLHSSLRDGSLRAAARNHGIRVLLFEGGEALRFDENAIRAGVDGTLRVLSALGMLADAPEPNADVRISRKSSWMRANRSGFSHTEVRLGDTVERGQCLARISDSLGKTSVEVRSRASGTVIGLLRTALVHRGDALVHVAEVSG